MVSIVRGISGIARSESTDPVQDASDYEHARSKLEEDLVGIRSTVKILSASDHDIGLSSDEIKTLNSLTSKFYSRAKFSSDEAKQLLQLRDKVGEMADMYASAEEQKTIAASSLLDTYQGILNDSRLTRSVRMTAMRELNGLLRVLNVNSSSLSTINMRKNNRIIDQAKAQLAHQQTQIKYSDTVKVANLTHRTKDERNSVDRFNLKQTGRNLRDSFMNTPSQISIGSVRKEALSSGLGALGLGDLDNVFGISDKLDNAISSMFRKRGVDSNSSTDEELKAISRDILKGDSATSGNHQPSSSSIDASKSSKASLSEEEKQTQHLREINDSIRDLVNETRGGLDEMSRKQTQLINGQSTLVDLDEQLISTTRANGRSNNEEINPFDDGKDKSAADSIFDTLLDGDGRSRGRRGRRRTRIGRTLGKFGRIGRMAGGAIDSAATGGLVRGAVRGGGNLLRAGIRGARFIPGIGILATAGLSAADAFSGWDSDKAKSLFGRDDNWAKAGSSAASLASGLTFGLASPEDVVNVAKSAVDTVQKTYDGAVSIANNISTSMSNAYKSVAGWLSDKVSGTAKWFSDSYDSVSESLSGSMDKLSDLVSDFINDPIKSIGEGIGSVFDWLSELPIIGKFFKALKNGGAVVKDGLIGAGSSIISGARAVGGMISNGYDAAIDAGGSILQSAMTAGARYLPTSKEQRERKDSLAAYAKEQGIGGDELGLFMGQVQHESGNFRYNKELASGRSYEGRSDLGNVNAGDGVRYKGRGWIQLTGRANYKKYGQMLGLDLENNPELAEDPEVANKLAVAYWKDRVQPQLAKKGATVEVATKAVNGGYNGLEDRAAYTAEWMKENPDVEANKSGSQVAQNVPLEVPKSASPADDVVQRQKDQQAQLAASAQSKSADSGTPAVIPPTVVSDKSDTIDDYGLAFFNKMVLS